eukprot:1771450-Pleurochrysis_carterae.AAC.2
MRSGFWQIRSRRHVCGQRIFRQPDERAGRRPGTQTDRLNVIQATSQKGRHRMITKTRRSAKAQNANAPMHAGAKSKNDGHTFASEAQTLPAPACQVLPKLFVLSAHAAPHCYAREDLRMHVYLRMQALTNHQM